MQIEAVRLSPKYEIIKYLPLFFRFLKELQVLMLREPHVNLLGISFEPQYLKICLVSTRYPFLGLITSPWPASKYNDSYTVNIVGLLVTGTNVLLFFTLQGECLTDQESP